ncbi:MAG: hypothetical protein Aurels2KO_50250 [Aureliella sp.]
MVRLLLQAMVFAVDLSVVLPTPVFELPTRANISRLAPARGFHIELRQEEPHAGALRLNALPPPARVTRDLPRKRLEVTMRY